MHETVRRENDECTTTAALSTRSSSAPGRRRPCSGMHAEQNRIPQLPNPLKPATEHLVRQRGPNLVPTINQRPPTRTEHPQRREHHTRNRTSDPVTQHETGQHPDRRAHNSDTGDQQPPLRPLRHHAPTLSGQTRNTAQCACGLLSAIRFEPLAKVLRRTYTRRDRSKDLPGRVVGVELRPPAAVCPTRACTALRRGERRVA